jgi:GMP synthase PP-ATPase subunit
VDEIFVQTIKDAGLYDTIWLASVMVLHVQTIGVQGDRRTLLEYLDKNFVFFEHLLLLLHVIRQA